MQVEAAEGGERQKATEAEAPSQVKVEGAAEQPAGEAAAGDEPAAKRTRTVRGIGRGDAGALLLTGTLDWCWRDGVRTTHQQAEDHTPHPLACTFAHTLHMSHHKQTTQEDGQPGAAEAKAEAKSEAVRGDAKAEPKKRRRTNMPLLLAFRWGPLLHASGCAHACLRAVLLACFFGRKTVCLGTSWPWCAAPLIWISTLTRPHLHYPCAPSTRYFDRTGCGYLRIEDLRRILHNLHTCLPHRTVRDLAALYLSSSSSDRKSSSSESRCYYRDFTEVVV